MGAMSTDVKTIIRGGLVFDGLGGSPIAADVALAGERIADVAPPGALDGAVAGADQVVEAKGLALCPGFIDAHSHSDAYLLLEPSAASKLAQGVTCEITGNCGASAAPRLPGYNLPSDWAAQHYPRDWTDVADYRKALEEARPAIHSRMLVGHRTIRSAVMGLEPRPASSEEVARMVRLMDEALEQGGAGVSTGLIYAPAMFAGREELVALARCAGRHGGLYATHMRSEGAGLLEAIDEAVAIAREADCPLQISHLKTAGKSNWHKLPAALDRIEAARAEGLDVFSDRYPYTASCTDMDVLLPEWAGQGGNEMVYARLADPAMRARIADEIRAARPPEYWEGVHIAFTRQKGFAGRPLLDYARTVGLPPPEAMLHLISADGPGTMGIFFGMSEDNLWEIWSRPWVMGGSDASIRAPWGPLGEDHPHPRAYGTFPRLLAASRTGGEAAKKGISMAEAIRKCTSLPAARFRLRDRGVIRQGAFADLVLFDPETIADTATYARPHSFPSGIRSVFVDGEIAWQDGKPTGIRRGRYLAP